MLAVVTSFSHKRHELCTQFGHLMAMKPRVLVVDDDTEFVQLIEFNLKQAGCDSLMAHSGVQALRIARAELPDVILMDVMLPDLDGLSVCEILNSQPSTREIPVVMITALDESWTQTRKSKARYAGFFTKPIDLKALRDTVRSAADQRQALTRSRLAEKET
jgi:CheY-like chemotaxis protein